MTIKKKNTFFCERAFMGRQFSTIHVHALIITVGLSFGAVT